MKSRMLSIAISSSKRTAGRRRRQSDQAESPDLQTLEEGREDGREHGQDEGKEDGKGRHLKSVEAEESESDSSEAEIEVGANASAPDVAGLPIEASPDADSGAAVSGSAA